MFGDVSFNISRWHIWAKISHVVMDYIYVLMLPGFLSKRYFLQIEKFNKLCGKYYYEKCFF